MKTVESDRFVTNSTDFKTKTFGIKSHNLSHIISIVRDQIYSDKILAVIREYSCNACDANVMNGQPTVPIIVTLPSKLSPEFKVRDFGGGLSEQEIEDIFISYGESTKRNTNDAIGTLGIGSKSGFAYGDNFIVTSYNNGMKTVYDCILDKTNVGNCIELLSEPMGADDKEGIEITINVKKDDVEDFRKKAVNFFKYWTVKPELVGFDKETLAVKEKTVLFNGTNWTIYGEEESRSYYHRSSESLALMGNIAYPINWDTVRLPKTTTGENEAMMSYLKSCNLIIRFNIGDVQFAPSREALQYTDYTNEGIAKAMKVIMSEIEVVITDKFKNCKNLFEAKTLFGTLFGHSTYSGGQLGDLRSYFMKKGLMWNGIKITSSQIEGFNKYELTKGYNPAGHDLGYGNGAGAFPISRYAMGGSVLKCKKGNHHDNSYNNIQCDATTMVLLYDTTKHNYVRKAVHYLMGKNPTISTVYALDFKDNTSLKDLCFKNLNLDLVPMTKYSDIMEDVKKSIVRYTGNGTRSVVNKDTNIRNARVITVKDHTYDHGYRSRRYSDCWNGVDVNFKTDTGYYVAMDSDTLKWEGKNDGIGNIFNVCKLVNMLNVAGVTNIEKIHGFGPRILEGKVFDASKWTRIETLITTKLAEMTTNDAFKWYAAFKKASGKFTNGEVPSWSLVNRLAKKITDKNNPFCQLSELLKHHNSNRTDVYDNLLAMVGSKVSCGAEVAQIDTLTKSIIKSYPMLVLMGSYHSNYADDDNDYKAKEITVVTNYINQMDSLANP